MTTKWKNNSTYGLKTVKVDRVLNTVDLVGLRCGIGKVQPARVDCSIVKYEDCEKQQERDTTLPVSLQESDPTHELPKDKSVVKVEINSTHGDCQVESNDTTTNEFKEITNSQFNQQGYLDLDQLTETSLYEDISLPLMEIKEEASPFKSAAQDVALPSLLEDTECDNIMSDSFFEEYLDLDNLFPDLDLVLGSEDQQNPEVPDVFKTHLTDDSSKNEVSTFPNDLATFLLEDGCYGNGSEVKVEVVEEASSPSVDQEITELLSAVSSPGSVDSDTTAFSFDSIEEAIGVEIPVEDLIDLLVADPAVTVLATNTPSDDAAVHSPSAATAVPEACHPEVELVTPRTQTTQLKRKCSDSEIPRAEESKRKKTCPEDTAATSPADKARERRIKNNIASRHTRAARKQREQQLFEQEESLKKSNEELREQIELLTKETEELRRIVIQKLSGVSVL